MPVRNAEKGAWVQDISPDLSELLVINPRADEDFARGAVQSVPILGGSTRRIGDFDATSAAWSPDGKKIVYSDGNDLYATNPDGSQTRKLWTAPGYIRRIRFSPDGYRLRFEVYEAAANTRLLWQVNVEGGDARRVLATNPQLYSELSGNWTPDGKYYVFPLWQHGASNLYALRETAGRVSPDSGTPIQLTTGPIDMHYVVPSKDGHRLFAIGEQWEAQIEKFDGASKQFHRLMNEATARSMAFSRDGQWVVYSDHNSVLWRSRVDGSEKLQLTVPPLMTHEGAQWSPDGSQIVFSGVEPDRLVRSYIISAKGGVPQRVTPEAKWEQALPTWCSGGKSVVYGEVPYPGHTSAGVHLVDVASGRESILADSQSFYYPRCSPDSRWVVAIAPSPRRFMLFDTIQGKWSQLLKLDKNYDDWVWGRDSEYLYFSTLDPDAAIYRVRISDGKLERVADLKDIPRTNYIAMAPDGSPLIERKISSPQVYALDWKIK